MTNICQIKIKFPDFGKAASEIKQELPGIIAATMQTQRAIIFDSSGRYNGHKGWKPLQFRDGQPLKDTGKLSQSIGPMNDGMRPGHGEGTIVKFGTNIVTIGTNIAYAHIHNNGGIIRPKTKKALRFQYGKKVFFRKKVVIPERRFDDFTNKDIKEIRETIENYLADVIGSV